MKVLLVDDEPLIREMLSTFFESSGVEAVCAACGEEALVRIEMEHFDLLVTDLNMPGMDGSTLALKVRQRFPEFPIYAFSAFPGGAVPAAFDEVFSKPEDFSRLVASVIQRIAGEKCLTTS